MSNVTGITGKLCNKCPKRQVEQNCSSSDSFNAISGFTSNSRAPGGPVTLQLFQLGYKTSEFTVFFVLIFLEKIKDALTSNPVQSVANVSVHWMGGKKTFFKNFCKREN